MTDIARFDLAVIDPPWVQTKISLTVRPNQVREIGYPTMQTPELRQLLLSELLPYAEKNHALFVWTIESHLLNALQLFSSLDYTKHTTFIWDKGSGVSPFTVRFQHEYLIWFYAGKMQPVALDVRGKFATVINEASRQHSRKPDKAYRLIDHLYPEAKKIDVFSREKRVGWQQWGNECDYYKEYVSD